MDNFCATLNMSIKYTGWIYRVNQKTFVIVFMPQKINVFLLIVFTFLMSLIMVAINKTMDFYLHYNKNYYYNS